MLLTLPIKSITLINVEFTERFMLSLIKEMLKCLALPMFVPSFRLQAWVIGFCSHTCLIRKKFICSSPQFLAIATSVIFRMLNNLLLTE